MEMEYDDLIRVCEQAFQMLYEKDKELFIADVQERAIAGRLAIYLQHILDPNFKNEHRIDIEYNREGNDTKRRHPEDKKGWMAPDIIWHKRGNERGNNVFYFEMKKAEDENNGDSIRVKDALWERNYIFGINLYAINERCANLSIYRWSGEFVREDAYTYYAEKKSLECHGKHRLWLKKLIRDNQLDWVAQG